MTQPVPTPEEIVGSARERGARQVERQTNTPVWAGPRPLDWAPLAADLHAGPLPDADLAFASLAELLARIDAGALTSLALTRLYLDRIRRLDAGTLNSLITLNPEALADARARDAEAPRGPLHGLPILLKDNIGTRGPMRTTAGAWALRDAVCDRDSAVAERLRAAGAVLLGKANLSEWANWTTDGMPNGFSSVGGQTHNPYGRFDVSGSSSGSAVAVAAGLCAAAIGSETWGSLVSPASANSVATLKPSLGLISRDRIVPITEAQDTAGPMARSVADLAALMNVLAGPDPRDPETEAARSLAGTDYAAMLKPNALRGMRVGIVRQSHDIDPEAPVWRAWLAEALRAAGAEPVEVAPQSITETRFEDDFMPVGHFDFQRGVDAYLAASGAPFRNLAEIVAWNTEDAANRVPWGQTLLVASATQHTTVADYLVIRDRNRSAARARIDALLQESHGALLVGVEDAGYIPFAIAGAPALTLPFGYRETGEPVGVTFIGRFLDDPQLIAAGYALEQMTQARRPPHP